ncbi:glycogen debranching protein GlgX [Limnoglobus roseus]|uniref:Retaining isoamylase n=1 Tax=Limnoglobus roseus TaxID=2598579 RepID=A0A5C1AAZ5_9BACT|nr:glycogen debranching protein GlgX [Limnoglobus roseus]QEL14208.1 retaining isoamylase [Limnoglobus roseus]
MPDFPISRGRPLPLGVSPTPDGVNFVLLCRHGTDVRLVILPEQGGKKPLMEFRLDGRKNRTGDHWHVRVHDLPDTFTYGWRVDGPSGTKHRFDPSRILLDPAATMISGGAKWADTCETDPERTSRRALYHRAKEYDWGEDAPPLTAYEDSVIYEVHVRGFTCHPSSMVANPGTFAGLVEKIPYLQWLGVTAVELLPIHEFDECDCPFVNPKTGEKMTNFWGYNSIAFAAPKAAYAASAGEHGQIAEFRDMVKAFHKAGIEVILDVVFNHTGEGDDRGRTYSYRGLDNELYYLLDDHGRYLNYSGCGNTVNCNHPVVRDLLLTCLRYWGGHMHVDGFRFDLASILGRDSKGNVLVDPPVIEMIAEDGVLADCKLIAEPWDAAGLYQVGNFPFGRRWSEWNGKYRDDVRRFWRGELGMTGPLAARLCGSADIYQWNGRLPKHSVNFITAHDGFTLNDLLSYNGKHNELNGEQNRDGSNENYSWNCGAEGPSDDPLVTHLRQRQGKNLMVTLMLSQGVPMLLAGDEFLRTQKGNNNAWCHDNEISWVDWELEKTNRDFLRFVKELIWFRRRHPALRRRRFFRGEVDPQEWGSAPVGPFPASGPVRPSEAGKLDDSGRVKASATSRKPRVPALPNDDKPLFDIEWHGVKPFEPDFGHYSRTLAYTIDGRFTGREGEADYDPDVDFYVAVNSYHEAIRFQIPPSPSNRKWRCAIDTAADSPKDFIAEGEGPVVRAGSYISVPAFSTVVLVTDR